jgi:hypothetical protein
MISTNMKRVEEVMQYGVLYIESVFFDKPKDQCLQKTEEMRRQRKKNNELTSKENQAFECSIL